MAALGRPRSFDRDAALDAAMLLFWKQGYLATSMNDLCQAMGIASPSLYAAFGSKEDLYVEAIARYVATIRPMVWDRLAEGRTARAGVERFLRAAARALPGLPEAPRGCMVTLAPPVDVRDGVIDEVVRAARRDGLDVLRERIEEGVAAGDVPRGTNAARLARYVLAVFQGMAIQARDGATTAELDDVVRSALAAWPAGPASGRASRAPTR